MSSLSLFAIIFIGCTYNYVCGTRQLLHYITSLDVLVALKVVVKCCLVWAVRLPLRKQAGGAGSG